MKTLLQRFRIGCAGMFLVLSFSVSAQHSRVSPEADVATRWVEWCQALKEELSTAKVFSPAATYVTNVAKMNRSEVVMLNVDSLLIPLPRSELHDIKMDTNKGDATTLAMSFGSSLRATVVISRADPVSDVFGEMPLELPDSILDYIEEKFGSTTEFTRRSFGEELTPFDLRVLGFGTTLSEIECTARSIDADLVKIPAKMAAASPDYEASSSGNAVVYWSENELPGIVTRQAEQFSLGQRNLRVLWSGEFQQAQSYYNVIISFDRSDADQFDYLGRLLASPALNDSRVQ